MSFESTQSSCLSVLLQSMPGVCDGLGFAVLGVQAVCIGTTKFSGIGRVQCFSGQDL